MTESYDKKNTQNYNFKITYRIKKYKEKVNNK